MKCEHCPLSGACVGQTQPFACKMAESGTESELVWIANQSAGVVEYPPIATQAVTAIKAAVKFAASGFKTVDDERYERRLEICKACPLFDAAQNRCKSCGCYTASKLKMASESCPHPEGPRWSSE